MKNRIGKRCVSFALVLSIFAFLFAGVSSSGLAVSAVVNSVASLGSVFKGAVNSVVGAGKVAADALDKAASMVSFRFSLDRTDLVSPQDLLKYVDEFNSLDWFYAALATNNSIRGVYEQAKAILDNSEAGKPYATPRLDPTTSYNTVRPYIDGYGWLVDADGNYPFCDTEEYNAYVRGLNAGTVKNPSTQISTNAGGVNKWHYLQDGDLDLANFSLVGKEALSNAAVELGVGLSTRAVHINGKWVKVYFIYKTDGGGAYYCDSAGRPFAALVEEDKAAVNNQFNYTGGDVTIKNDSDNTEVKDSFNTDQSKNWNQIFDIDAGKLVLVDENGNYVEQNIDSLYYDASTNTYTADTYNYTYNNEFNFYEINYYTYNIQYTYNNTYVTYIGSTAEYQPKEWKFYYELPDGRSSADLTEEDIAGLSFQFADVVNYKQSAADTSLRALYHFDGNTQDSSYWSNQGSFAWDRGASITYMESNAFNGALYLDEKEHQFTITLPSSIGSGDFSLQWRYYQNSATTTENNDNYVSIGGKKLFSWSEQYLYGLGTQKYRTGLSVGSWQELALIRQNGQLYFYHNGVVLGSVPMLSSFNNKIVFSLGAESRAYSMIDELRFVNFAVAKGGAAYTPTAVPYDTNNVLVLPEGAELIADEYYQWDTKVKPYVAYDLTNGDSTFSMGEPTGQGSVIYAVETEDFSTNGGWMACPQSTVYVDDGFVHIQSAGTMITSGTSYHYGSLTNNQLRFRGGGLAIGLGDLNSSRYTAGFTVSVVDRDLNRYSLTVSGPFDSSTKAAVGDGQMHLMSFREVNSNDDEVYNCQFLAFENVSSLDLIYVEVTPKGQYNTGHKLISAVYSSDEVKPNTAAIQSSIPVAGYTVGGVRPTFPQRGDVWMPVQGSRISGVYIYNGQAWEETNARWWTGKRWIPIYAFDLVTLADMWDVGSSSGEEVTPPISSEQGFWNWWKNQWLDFRRWLSENLGSGGDSIVFPPPSECEHAYKEQILTEPSCTRKGSALYVCSKCGDSYTDTVDASGHDWLLVDSIPDELGVGYADITDNFVSSLPVYSQFATIKNLLDGDLSTVHRATLGFGFKLINGSPYVNMDMVIKVEFDFIIDGDCVTIPLLTPLPHFDPNGTFSIDRDNLINLPVEYNGNALLTFRFNYGVYTSSQQVSGYMVNLIPGESYSAAEGDGLPALAEVRFFTEGPGDPIPGTGYDIYRCSVCGAEYKDYERTGPPVDDGSNSTLSELIQQLFDALGRLVGSLIDWVLDLAAEAMEGFGSLGDYFKEKAEEVQGFGGEYVGFFGAFFEIIPPEIKTCITLALICGGLLLFIHKVIL